MLFHRTVIPFLANITEFIVQHFKDVFFSNRKYLYLLTATSSLPFNNLLYFTSVLHNFCVYIFALVRMNCQATESRGLQTDDVVLLISQNQTINVVGKRAYSGCW